MKRALRRVGGALGFVLVETSVAVACPICDTSLTLSPAAQTCFVAKYEAWREEAVATGAVLVDFAVCGPIEPTAASSGTKKRLMRGDSSMEIDGMDVLGGGFLATLSTPQLDCLLQRIPQMRPLTEVITVTFEPDCDE